MQEKESGVLDVLLGGSLTLHHLNIIGITVNRYTATEMLSKMEHAQAKKAHSSASCFLLWLALRLEGVTG